MKKSIIVLMLLLGSGLLRAETLCGGASQPVAVDLTVGERTTHQAEFIAYSTDWESDNDDAVAVVSVNGTTLSEQAGNGTAVWTPSRNGTYVLTHTVMTNGVQVGETLTATFMAEGFNPETPVISPTSGTTFDSSLTVSMTCASEGATIHYTTDGSTPILESPTYKRFRISGKTTIKAIAFYEDGSASDMAVAEYALGQCADPVISLADGTVFKHSNQEVSISYSSDGTLRYTLDGTDPTAESPEYTGAFTISDTTVIKAKVFSDSFFDSKVVTATLTREWEQVAMPVITAVASFSGSKTVVMLSCATDGATIRYTTNGNDPNSHSTKYAGPFEVTASCTVKAYAVLADCANSEIASWSIEKIWGIGDSLGVPDQTFTTSGDKGWVRDTEVSYDGSESMRSGAITNEESSILSTVVSGKGTFSFWWKTSCEEDVDREQQAWDHAEFAVDGVEVARIDGITNWVHITQELTTEGDHTLTWTYTKDDVEFDGQDCAWVDAFTWTPADPIPSIGDTPTAAEISSALSGSKDTRLAAYLTTGAKYKAYRAWADRIAGSATVNRQAIKDSAHAWLSYALDCDALLTKAPAQGEMKIAAFEKNAATGTFDFLVAVDGIMVGTGATAENLATLFGIEGCAAIDGTYSAENVTFTFGTPVDGKVKISAMPTDTMVTQFFLKVKMTP